MQIVDGKLLIKNKAFFGFFTYVAFILLTEYFNFINYWIGNVIHFLVADALSIGVIAFLFFRFRKKIVFEKNGNWKNIVLGSSIIVALFFLMSFYPDQGYDTFNYHLAAQNPYFENYFISDFGYGNFQIWGFRLPNRLFYLFRLIFGYRLGTSLNLVTMVITFIGVYRLLDVVLKKMNVAPENPLTKALASKTIWALLITLQFDSVLMIGSYYVELLALPIAIELLTIIIEHKDKQNLLEIGYFAFLCGLMIAFKMTNVIYVLPFVVAYFILYVKKTKVYSWFVAAGVGLVPFIIYIIFNAVCTGNPVFPYFNTIFKSPYYPLENFKDLRWGGTSFFQQLFWVVLALFRPDYRQCEIPEYLPYSYFLGFLSIIIFACVCIHRWRKHEETNEVYLSYVLLFAFAAVSGILWGFSTGYSRYYVFGKMIWCIMGYWVGAYLLKFEWNVSYGTKAIMTVAGMAGMFMNVRGFYEGTNWSWTAYDQHSMSVQLGHALRDHDITTKYDLDVDMFFVTDVERAGVAELVDDSVFVFNAAYKNYSTYNYQETLDKKLAECSNIYDIYKTHLDGILDYANNLSSYSFMIDDIKHLTVGSGEYNFMKVRYEENAENKVYVHHDDLTIPYVGETGHKKLSFIAARYFAWESEKDNDISVEIYVKNETEENLVSTITVNTINPSKHEIELDIKENDIVYMKAFYKGGGVMTDSEPDKFMAINPCFN